VHGHHDGHTNACGSLLVAGFTIGLHIEHHGGMARPVRQGGDGGGSPTTWGDDEVLEDDDTTVLDDGGEAPVVEAA
jgi:hypothetical protein